MDEDDLSRRLHDIAGDVPDVEAIRLDMATRGRGHSRQRQRLSALAVAASVAVVGGVILLVGQRSDHPTPPAEQPAPPVSVTKTSPRTSDKGPELRTSQPQSGISPMTSKSVDGTTSQPAPSVATATAGPPNPPTTPRPSVPAVSPVTSRGAPVKTRSATTAPLPTRAGTSDTVPALPATKTVPPTEPPTTVAPASTVPTLVPPPSTSSTVGSTPTTPGR